jgi:hypothetical protein
MWWMVEDDGSSFDAAFDMHFRSDRGWGNIRLDLASDNHLRSIVDEDKRGWLRMTEILGSKNLRAPLTSFLW